jgi:hypothetical protein
MITIAEASAEAIQKALLRHWCLALRERRPPHDDAPEEAAHLAGVLGRTLTVLDLLRGTRRSAEGLQRRAAGLLGRLAVLGLVPPSGR